MADDAVTAARTKVAILGGGPAGLAAAMALSATPDLRARFDVTIYQSGWRVGGKCGQGRSGPANRIEINGTHYLFGGYRQVFTLAREVFDDLAARGDQRFGTFDEQFLPCSTVAVKDFFNGNWTTWVINLPGDGIPPGGTGGDPTLGDALRGVIGWMIDGVTAAQSQGIVPAAAHAAAPEAPHWWERLADFLGRELRAAEHLVGEAALYLARELAEKLEHAGDDPVLRDALVWILTHIRSWGRDLLGGLAKTHIEIHRLALLVDLGTTVLIGLLVDDVLGQRGFDGIDGEDLRAWILKHGALPTTAWSAPLATWYNAIAAYEQGDPMRPNMSAGMGLRGILRLGLTYQGAFSFQLSCEVGDSLIAPLSQVLHDRGVKTWYFHRVWDVTPDATGAGIAAIALERQADLAAGDPAGYQPFMHLPNGRPVWPDEPLREQLKNPPPEDMDLLSFYAPRTGPTVTLERGRDFDVAIYAMPVATARWLAKDLVATKPAWQAMVDHLATTETQSLRMWTKDSVEEMGWTHGQAVLSGFYQPLATWEDARQLLATETWPPDRQPKGIATIFGVLPGMPAQYPDPSDTGYPARRLPLARETALQFCTYFAGALWPTATALANPVGMDWDQLVTLERGIVGSDRLWAQDIDANVGPVEAYTQIRAGTLQYRLRADESGCDNLFLAGDWIRNGYEVGSVEGAVLGGQQAAAAIIAKAGA